MHRSLSSRILGFGSSLVLTLAAFFIIMSPDFFHLSPRSAIYTILLLAMFQAVVQSIFFLDILNEKWPRWNLVVFASTLSIILIIIIFSIWIMNHLDVHMMY